MCLAIPGRVKSIDGEKIVVDYDGVEKKAVNANLKLKKGDYVLVQAGIAVTKLDRKEARESLKALKGI
jgi:hydrogenase expression/formation protein HypC